MPIPFSRDKDGWQFVGWHINDKADWTYNPDFVPTNVAPTNQVQREAALFTTFNPRAWMGWFSLNLGGPSVDHFVLADEDGRRAAFREFDQWASGKVYAHEIWVRGDPQDLQATYASSAEMYLDEVKIHRGAEVLVKKSIPWGEAVGITEELDRALYDRFNSPLEILKRFPFGEIDPGKPSEWLGASLGVPDEQRGIFARELMDLVTVAPIGRTPLYKMVDITDQELQRLTIGERIIEPLGTWAADLSDLPRRAVRQTRSRVIFITKSSRHVFIAPFMASARVRTASFLVSGEFRVSRVITEILDDGTPVTWVEIDYVRKVLP
jgi:hypothetical protein